MMTSLAGQTHPPSAVWITVFGGTVRAELRTEFDAFLQGYSGGTKFEFVSGTMSLGYYGRIQIGLQATTPYTVFLDDDCMPGDRFFANSLRIMGTNEYRGLLGIKGHRTDLEMLDLEYYGPLDKTNYIVEADVVGGGWIVETGWVRLAFQTRHFTWGTGEDYTWCANLRKYANVPCFVLPFDPHLPPTWGVSKDYTALSERGDTTDHAKILLRRELAQSLWQRGAPAMHVTKEVWQASNLLFVVSSLGQVSHAVAFIKTNLALMPNVEQSVFWAYTGPSQGDGEVIRQLKVRGVVTTRRRIRVSDLVWLHGCVQEKTAAVMKDGAGCCRGSSMRLFDLGATPFHPRASPSTLG